MKKSKIRLFSDVELNLNQVISLDKNQTHYLFHVMKQEMGNFIALFDNKNGEFIGEIISINKKSCQLKIIEKSKDFTFAPDVYLLFSPVKKDNNDFIIQKSTELGVRKIIPVVTDYTNNHKFKIEKFKLNAIEASEQCRRVDIPEIDNPIKLSDLLSKWDSKRIFFYMNETGEGEDIFSVFSKYEKNTPSAILVGPEGGFSEEELAYLSSLEFAKSVTLGSRILRAETAVVSSLSIWQATIGDWA
jgi:16S rRNA (uracil1498-N3)-methyltransferase